MVAANKLLHLLEAFTSSWFLFSSPQNHHLAFFLLEVFNNIIQYQFDGENISVKSADPRPGRHSGSSCRQLPSLPPQVTATSCMPSSGSAAFSTSWPTCRLIWAPSKKPCRGGESLGCPGPPVSHQSPRRAPDQLHRLSLARSKPASRPPQVAAYNLPP